MEETKKWVPSSHSVIIFILVVLFAIQLAFFRIQVSSRPWSPLCEYETVQVLNPKEGKYPVLKPTDELVLKASHCLNEDSVVKIRTQIFWATQEPLGTSIEVTPTLNEASPGAGPIVWVKQIPESVQARNDAFESRYQAELVWVMRGVNTPVRGSEEGAPVDWVSEPFLIDQDT